MIPKALFLIPEKLPNLWMRSAYMRTRYAEEWGYGMAKEQMDKFTDISVIMPVVFILAESFRNHRFRKTFSDN